MQNIIKNYSSEEACYTYVSEPSESYKKAITDSISSAMKQFNIKETVDGKSLALSINNIVDNILVTGCYPEYYECIDDIAVELGCLYGHALCLGYGWKWMMIGNSSDNLFLHAVSDDENWAIPCMSYVNRILNGKNYGLDGANDNTILLLYNMIAECMNNTPDKKLTILS